MERVAGILLFFRSKDTNGATFSENLHLELVRVVFELSFQSFHSISPPTSLPSEEEKMSGNFKSGGTIILKSRSFFQSKAIESKELLEIVEIFLFIDY